MQDQVERGEGGFVLRRFRDPAGLLARARAWLLADEAANNLLLGMLGELDAAGGARERPFLATVERRDEVEGCMLRRPAGPLLHSEFPAEAVPEVVAGLGSTAADIRTVVGPDPLAQRVAEGWGKPRGLVPRVHTRLSLQALGELRLPAHRPPGAVRPGNADEADLMVRWAEGFAADTGMGLGSPGRFVEAHLASSSLFVWADDGPRSMAVVTGRTPRGARIGWVYTPPDLRGRGYASALVGEMSAALRSEGVDHLVLYTDRDNPTSNAIYRRLGYRPIADAAEVALVAPGEGSRETGSS